MKERYTDCSAEIGSVTQAMKAQEVLSAAAVPSRIIKSETSSRRGCVYGISFSCPQEKNVHAILANARISVKHWNRDESL